MARIWEAWLTEKFADKKRLWAILSAIFDVALIGLLILVLVNRSCEICYQTNGISSYVRTCTSVPTIYATGNPRANEFMNVSELPPTQYEVTEYQKNPYTIRNIGKAVKSVTKEVVETS